MDTPVAPIDPTLLLKELTQAIEFARQAAEIDERYAQSYAYDALVKEHVNNTDEARERARRAALSAFTHDGRRRGAESAAYTLVTLQKLLLTLMAEATARAEAQPDSIS